MTEAAIAHPAIEAPHPAPARPCAAPRGLEMFSDEPEGPDGPPAGGAAGEETAPAPDAKRLRVAIVEDEALIAIELEDMLTAIGAEVVGVAGTAEEAVRLADEERPDAMTMDIRLRGERDGISAALEIFERFGIRCVFVSAYGDAETVARAQSASPLGWILKPLHRDQLEAPLRAIWPGGKV